MADHHDEEVPSNFETPTPSPLLLRVFEDDQERRRRRRDGPKLLAYKGFKLRKPIGRKGSGL